MSDRVRDSYESKEEDDRRYSGQEDLTEDSRNQDWLMLPEIVLEDIMLMIGLSSPRDLDSCTQVCRTWNVMIRVWVSENPTKKWGTVIQSRLERSWEAEYRFPSDEKISYAKCLGVVYTNSQQKKTKKCLKIIFRN